VFIIVTVFTEKNGSLIQQYFVYRQGPSWYVPKYWVLCSGHCISHWRVAKHHDVFGDGDCSEIPSFSFFHDV